MTVVRPMPEAAETETHSGESATTQPRASSSICTSTSTAPPAAGTDAPTRDRPNGEAVIGKDVEET